MNEKMNEKITEAQKMFQTSMTDLLGRWTVAVEEFAKVETKAADQLRTALDECGRLAKAQLEYGLKLSADFREIALQTVKKATTTVQPPAQSV